MEGGGYFSGSLPLIACLRPTFEVSAGYSYARYNANPRIPGVPTSENVNGNGVSGQFAFNPSSRIGLVAEVAGYAISRQGFATTHEVSYLFGPHINLRRGRITPFVQTLFGRQWAEDGITLGSVSAYAMTVGGGELMSRYPPTSLFAPRRLNTFSLNLMMETTINRTTLASVLELYFASDKSKPMFPLRSLDVPDLLGQAAYG